MTQISVPIESESFAARAWRWIKAVNPIYYVVLALLAAVAYINPAFFEPNNFLGFLERAAPLMILTAGQVYVLVSGGFDLSVGSIVTYSVISAAILANNDPGSTWWVILFILGSGALFGLISGSIVTYLKVPSLIATLGMLLIIRGIGLFWSGGAPRGYLPDNYRALGRGGIEGFFGLREFPYAVIILVVVGILMWLLMHRLNYGKQLFAIGDNPRAGRLSGVNVEFTRIAAFVICGAAAALAGIMIGGRGGVSIEGGHWAGDADDRGGCAGWHGAARWSRQYPGSHGRGVGPGSPVYFAESTGITQAAARCSAGLDYHWRGGLHGL